jgi:hypothetical protein
MVSQIIFPISVLFFSFQGVAVHSTPVVIEGRQVGSNSTDVASADTKKDEGSSITLPAMTPVDIEIITPLNSKTVQIGQSFDIRLRQAITLNGITVVPVGASGKGEVIHATKARAMGRAGEIILAARFIEFGSQKIPLRSFRFGETTGESNRDQALAAGIVFLPAMFVISGGNINIPSGTKAAAKTATDIVIFQQEGQ